MGIFLELERARGGNRQKTDRFALFPNYFKTFSYLKFNDVALLSTKQFQLSNNYNATSYSSVYSIHEKILFSNCLVRLGLFLHGNLKHRVPNASSSNPAVFRID